MAQAIGTLAVRLAAITGDFFSDLSAATKHIDRVAESAKTAGKAATVGFAGITAVIGLSVKASDDNVISLLRLNAALRDVGASAGAGDIVKYAEALAATGVASKDAVMAASTTLAALQLSGDEILTLLPGLADLSVALGTDIAGAAQQAGRALAGGSDNLLKMGLVMTRGQKAAWETANQYGRVAILADVMKESVGGAAQQMASTATAGTSAFAEAMGDLSESFGDIFREDVASVFRGIANVVRNLKDMFEELSPATKEVIKDIVFGTTAFFGLAAAITAVVAFEGPIVGMFSAIGATLTTVLLPALAGMAAGLAIVVAGYELASKASGLPWGSGIARLKADISAVGAMMKEMFTAAPPTLPAAPAASLARVAAKARGGKALDFGSGGPSAYDIEYDPNQASMLGANIDTWSEKQWNKQQQKTADQSAALPGMAGNAVLGAASEAASAAASETAAKLNALSQSFAAAAGNTDDATKKTEYLAKAQEYAAKAQQAQNAPNAGSVLQAGAQGFAQGGFIGAIIGVIGSLLGKLTAFADLMKELDPVIAEVMQVLNPIVRIFAQIVKFCTRFVDSAGMLAVVVEGLAWVLGKIADIVGAVFDGLATAWNWIIDAINAVIGWMGVNLNSLKIDMSDQADEVAPVLDDLASATEDATQGVEDMGQTAQNVAEALSNMPEGLNLALAKFNASNAGGGAGGAYSQSFTTNSQVAPINVEKIEIVANDPAQLADQLRSINKWNDFVTAGSTAANTAHSGKKKV